MQCMSLFIISRSMQCMSLFIMQCMSPFICCAFAMRVLFLLCPVFALSTPSTLTREGCFPPFTGVRISRTGRRQIAAAVEGTELHQLRTTNHPGGRVS